MQTSFPRALRATLLALVLLLGAGVAQADERPLDAPRAQGLVGERFDGYALVRDDAASAALRALVEQTNGERRKVYAAQAAKTGAPAADVGKVYAAEILQKAPAGTWFLGPDGRWQQK